MEAPIIYKKMSDIFKDIEFIGKNKKNQQQGFNFRGIDDMYNELHDLFAKHEVFIISEVCKITREERSTKSGGNLIYTILEVKVSFFATDGSNVSSLLIGEAMDSADKSSNKAMSAALKYALMQTFLIPTEELKDADLTTPEASTKKAVPVKDLLPDAIAEMKACKTIEALKSCWSKWKVYQETPKFAEEKETTKLKLTVPTPTN